MKQNFHILNQLTKKKAFTLAEVIVTIGIIGIIATLTLHTLLDNQKIVYSTQLQKAYKEFNQALANITADKGYSNDIKGSGIMDVGTDHQTLGDDIVKYFKINKNCGSIVNSGCFSSSVAPNYDGSGVRTSLDNGYYKFITLDNIAYRISNNMDNCFNDWSSGATGQMKQVCGELFIDVNGPIKGPNNLGRDIFRFWITNGKGAQIYPYGGVDDKGYGSNRWWKNIINGAIISCYPNNTKGERCGGRLIEESWQMNY